MQHFFLSCILLFLETVLTKHTTSHNTHTHTFTKAPKELKGTSLPPDSDKVYMAQFNEWGRSGDKNTSNVLVELMTTRKLRQLCEENLWPPTWIYSGVFSSRPFFVSFVRLCVMFLRTYLNFTWLFEWESIWKVIAFWLFDLWRLG